MSDDREHGSDGLLIGILVVLVVLVIGGLGLTVFGIRFARVERERAVMEAEQARYAEQSARLVAEQATKNAEQASRVGAETMAGQEAAPPNPGTDESAKNQAKPD